MHDLNGNWVKSIFGVVELSFGFRRVSKKISRGEIALKFFLSMENFKGDVLDFFKKPRGKLLGEKI